MSLIDVYQMKSLKLMPCEQTIFGGMMNNLVLMCPLKYVAQKKTSTFGFLEGLRCLMKDDSYEIVGSLGGRYESFEMVEVLG